jgi:hypothetical protein
MKTLIKEANSMKHFRPLTIAAAADCRCSSEDACSKQIKKNKNPRAKEQTNHVKSIFINN